MGPARVDPGSAPAACQAAWLTTLGVVARLLRAGLTDAEIGCLIDLRIRLQRGGYVDDGGRCSCARPAGRRWALRMTNLHDARAVPAWDGATAGNTGRSRCGRVRKEEGRPVSTQIGRPGGI
jgi:hypothetical protein